MSELERVRIGKGRIGMGQNWKVILRQKKSVPKEVSCVVVSIKRYTKALFVPFFKEYNFLLCS